MVHRHFVCIRRKDQGFSAPPDPACTSWHKAHGRINAQHATLPIRSDRETPNQHSTACPNHSFWSRLLPPHRTSPDAPSAPLPLPAMAQLMASRCGHCASPVLALTITITLLISHRATRLMNRRCARQPVRTFPSRPPSQPPPLPAPHQTFTRRTSRLWPRGWHASPRTCRMRRAAQGRSQTGGRGDGGPYTGGLVFHVGARSTS